MMTMTKRMRRGEGRMKMRKILMNLILMQWKFVWFHWNQMNNSLFSTAQHNRAAQQTQRQQAVSISMTRRRRGGEDDLHSERERERESTRGLS
jgi:hypothetical protein